MKSWEIVVRSTGASDLIPNAAHIEVAYGYPRKITDFKAAKNAKKAGVALIDDIEGIYKDFYLDTSYNRKIINDYINSHPEELGTVLNGAIWSNMKEVI